MDEWIVRLSALSDFWKKWYKFYSNCSSEITKTNNEIIKNDLTKPDGKARIDWGNDSLVIDQLLWNQYIHKFKNRVLVILFCYIL